MTRTMAFAFAFCWVAATYQAAAQPLSYDRVLIPIAVDNAAGAFGAVWSSVTWIHNPNAFAVDLRIPPSCIPLCVLPALQPHDSINILASEPPDNPGLILYVQRPSSSVWTYSRVYERTRQSNSFGAEIPVVREQQFYDRSFFLLDIPTASRFRVMLRVYGLDAAAGGLVTIRAFDYSDLRTYGSVDLSLSSAAAAPTLPGTSKPPYADIKNLTSSFPLLFDAAGKPTTTEFHLEITPRSPGLKIWGFVSVTDNDNHVTTITPH